VAARQAEERVQEVIEQVETLLSPRRWRPDGSLLAAGSALCVLLSALLLLDLLSPPFSAWMQKHAIVTGLVTGGVLVLATALIVDRLVRRQEQRKTDAAALSVIEDLGAACARGAWEILDVALKELDDEAPVVTSLPLTDIIAELEAGAGLDVFRPAVSGKLVNATRAVHERTKEIAARCNFLAGRDDVQRLLAHYQEMAGTFESLQGCGAFVLNDGEMSPMRAAAWYGVATAIALLPEEASKLLADANEARSKRVLLASDADSIRKSMETQMHADLLRDSVYRSSIEWDATIEPDAS
jgi:hypothetical protein